VLENQTPLFEKTTYPQRLENAIERAVVVGKERKIMAKDLPIFNPETSSTAHVKSIKEVEKAHIAQILDENNWNIARTAKILGINRSTLYTKSKAYEIRKH